MPVCRVVKEVFLVVNEIHIPAVLLAVATIWGVPSTDKSLPAAV